MKMSVAPTTASPDWSHIPFEVTCARCGHDLKGLTDPKCPACELTFDWSDAVPVEELLCDRCGYRLFGLTDTRCPECGEAFTWDGALAAVTRRRMPLFEYRWRQQFVRSLVASTVWAMRPSRLWQKAKLHDRPPIGPLLLFSALGIVAAWAVLVLGLTTIDWLRSGRTSLPPGYAWLLHFSRTMSRIVPMVTQISMCWWVFSLAALLVFRQSMRRYKVRFRHVVRVWCYSGFIALVWIAIILDMTTGLYAAILRTAIPLWQFRFVVEILIPLMNLVSPLAAVAYVIWFLRCGYKHYMLMDHPLSVASASQLIALLATATVYFTTRY